MAPSNDKRRRDLVSPVIGVDDAWVRPGELLVESATENDVAELLRKLGGRPYEPTGDKRDWRQFRNAPEYDDINTRLARAGLEFRLWTGFSDEDGIRLARDRGLPGVHFNHVFLGEDFYQGGPDGAPIAVSGPTPSLNWSGDQQVDIAVLDSGVPAEWAAVHPQLKDSVHQVGINRLPLDPVDENGDGVRDAQAGHGLFICGVVARVESDLDIQLSRVLHATGETDDSLLGPALAESTARVINLSLGGYTTDDKEPKVLAAAIRAVHQADRVIVAAAGNDGNWNPDSPHANREFWPAAMPEVLGVGACDTTAAQAALWPPSNRGEVYAPGFHLLSTYLDGWSFTGWARWSGTSFATPVVAATLADLLAKPHAGTAHSVVQSWLNSRPTANWPQVGSVKLHLPGQPLT
jgi:subtilisin family serine protease